jgi:hypothetical protein
LSQQATGGQLQQAVFSQNEVGPFWWAADAVPFILRRKIVGNVERARHCSQILGGPFQIGERRRRPIGSILIIQNALQ